MIPIAKGGNGTAHLPARVDHWQSTTTGVPAPKINYNNNRNSVKKKQTISVICTLPLWLHLCTQRQRLGPVGSTDHRRAHRSARATASTSHPLALDGLSKNNDNGVDVSLGSCARSFSQPHAHTAATTNATRFDSPGAPPRGAHVFVSAWQCVAGVCAIRSECLRDCCSHCWPVGRRQNNAYIKQMNKHSHTYI